MNFCMRFNGSSIATNNLLARATFERVIWANKLLIKAVFIRRRVRAP